MHFCPVVRKKPILMTLIEKNILGQAQAFAQTVGQAMLERALNWAYLSETEGSFAIEGEAPAADKASLFTALLRRAHERRPLTEDLLVELQNAAISNPFDKAVQFRTEHNRLQRDAPGAAGVTYVPPEPELAVNLMEGLMRLANRPPATLDPLVHAAVVSFAFVFIHPFMDGNGRLSRFLIHHCLGQSGRLPPGFLLPISVAMKKHEADYLQALTTFSQPRPAALQGVVGRGRTLQLRMGARSGHLVSPHGPDRTGDLHPGDGRGFAGHTPAPGGGVSGAVRPGQTPHQRAP